MQEKPPLVLIIRGNPPSSFLQNPGASALIVRALICVIALSGVISSARAQTSPAPELAAPSPAKPTVKSATKKAAPKARTSANLPAPGESGPCQIGVIPAIGDRFILRKIGLTVFGNDQEEAPIDSWGLDDLAVARVRAAAAGKVIRRIAYAKDAFAPYDNPSPSLFGANRADLTTIVRQVAANSRCERYLVVTKFGGQLAGTNQSLEGIGILNRSAGIIERNFLYANIKVTVFDGQTFEVQSNPAESFGARLSASLSGELDPKVTQMPFPQSAADAISSKQLRDDTRALLSSRLDRMLSAYLEQKQ
jgi:hypothetical protein